MLAHLASSACGIDTGDIFGTGTISSSVCIPLPFPMNLQLKYVQSTVASHRSFGCLLELNEGVKNSVSEYPGESLIWLEDGDEVVMTAKHGVYGMVLGELRNRVHGHKST
jgi:fumarylacetoacetase